MLGGYALPTVPVLPFGLQEIRAYLELHKVSLDHGRLIELVRASQGNPLYLYYFVHFQTDPLPSGLKAYQDALWRDFAPPQRELLGLIALSLFPVSVNLLEKAFDAMRARGP